MDITDIHEERYPEIMIKEYRRLKTTEDERSQSSSVLAHLTLIRRMKIRTIKRGAFRTVWIVYGTPLVCNI